MNPKLKQAIQLIFFLGIGIVLLWWAFKEQDLKSTWASIKNAHFGYIGLAMLSGLISHFIRGYRWNMLLNPMGYNANTTRAFLAVMSGYFANYIFPRLGEVTRCALLSKTDRIPIEKLIGTVVAERFVDLLVTILITVLIFFLQFDMLNRFMNETVWPMMGSSESNTKYYILAVMLCMAILFFIFKKQILKINIFNKIFNLIKGMKDGFMSVRNVKSPFWFYILSVSIWFFYFLSAYFVFYSIPATSHLGINAGLIVLFLGTIAIVIPIPGGIGVYHKLIPLGLVLFGISINDGTTYAAITHGTQMLMLIVLGGISAIIMSIWATRIQANGKA